MKPENDEKQSTDLERELETILARIDAMPVLDVRKPDEIVGYDEDGAPK